MCLGINITGKWVGFTKRDGGIGYKHTRRAGCDRGRLRGEVAAERLWTPTVVLAPSSTTHINNSLLTNIDLKSSDYVDITQYERGSKNNFLADEIYIQSKHRPS